MLGRMTATPCRLFNRFSRQLLLLLLCPDQQLPDKLTVQALTFDCNWQSSDIASFLHILRMCQSKFCKFSGWSAAGITVRGSCNAFACSTSFSAKTITHFPSRQPTHRRVQHGCTKRQHQHRGEIKRLRCWKSKEFKVVAKS